MTAAVNPAVVAVAVIALKVTGRSTTRARPIVSSGALAPPAMPTTVLSPASWGWKKATSRDSSMLRSLLGAVVASAIFALLAPAAVAQMSPKFRFLQFCVGCHQYDGTGLPPDVPSLRDDLSYLIGSPAGRDFMLRVPGVIGAPGSADEVAELLNWIVKSFYQGDANFTPFTAADVLSGRERPMHDPIQERLELLAGN